MSSGRRTAIAWAAVGLAAAVMIAAGLAFVPRLIEGRRVQALESVDREARLQAARKLGEEGSWRALPPLVALAGRNADIWEEEREAEYKQALQSLQLCIERNGPAAVQGLRKALEACPHRKPLEELLTKGATRTAALEALQLGLEDGRSEVRELCRKLLDSSGALTLDQLLGRLHSVADDVRSWVAGNLGSLGPGALAAVPALQRLLSDPSTPVRLEAASALLDIEGASAIPIAVILRWLEDPELDLRLKAAWVVWHKGREAREAIPILVERMRRKDLLHLAPLALHGMGEEACAPLLSLLGEADAEVRAAAVMALGKLGGEARQALAAIERALEDPDPRVQAEARGARQVILLRARLTDAGEAR